MKNISYLLSLLLAFSYVSFADEVVKEVPKESDELSEDVADEVADEEGEEASIELMTVAFTNYRRRKSHKRIYLFLLHYKRRSSWRCKRWRYGR